jgi:hypothetical protein
MQFASNTKSWRTSFYEVFIHHVCRHPAVSRQALLVPSSDPSRPDSKLPRGQRSIDSGVDVGIGRHPCGRRPSAWVVYSIRLWSHPTGRRFTLNCICVYLCVYVCVPYSTICTGRFPQRYPPTPFFVATSITQPKSGPGSHPSRHAGKGHPTP